MDNVQDIKAPIQAASVQRPRLKPRRTTYGLSRFQSRWTTSSGQGSSQGGQRTGYQGSNPGGQRPSGSTGGYNSQRPAAVKATAKVKAKAELHAAIVTMQVPVQVKALVDREQVVDKAQIAAVRKMPGPNRSAGPNRQTKPFDNRNNNQSGRPVIQEAKPQFHVGATAAELDDAAAKAGVITTKKSKPTPKRFDDNRSGGNRGPGGKTEATNAVTIEADTNKKRLKKKKLITHLRKSSFVAV